MFVTEMLHTITHRLHLQVKIINPCQFLHYHWILSICIVKVKMFINSSFEHCKNLMKTIIIYQLIKQNINSERFRESRWPISESADEVWAFCDLPRDRVDCSLFLNSSWTFCRCSWTRDWPGDHSDPWTHWSCQTQYLIQLQTGDKSK